MVAGPHKGQTLTLDAGGGEVRVGRNAPRKNGLRLDKDLEVSDKCVWPSAGLVVEHIDRFQVFSVVALLLSRLCRVVLLDSSTVALLEVWSRMSTRLEEMGTRLYPRFYFSRTPSHVFVCLFQFKTLLLWREGTREATRVKSTFIWHARRVYVVRAHQFGEERDTTPIQLSPG